MASVDDQTVIATARNNMERNSRYFNKNARNKNYRAISAVTNDNANFYNN